MTLEGTNSWLIGDPGRGPVVVVDPGPLLAEHLDAIVAAAPGGISTVLLTHRHLDHSEAAAALAARADCGVRAADPQFRVGAAGLEEGERLDVAGASLTVLATPGHTSDSVSALLEGEDGVVRLLSGDMVLGRGTTVITHPDGDLGGYLNSLARLQRLVVERDVIEILPGHGPVVTDPAGWLAYYREHRLERLDQVRAAVAAGARTPTEVVARVYAEVDRSLWPAAEQSVGAQLAYLADRSEPPVAAEVPDSDNSEDLHR
jgi:glyoxylase-like metal-dependent hydrolase (beta-lactamase superfamily II)